jgi:hypothetical protein
MHPNQGNSSHPISDEMITQAIQHRLGLRGVQQLQQELVEGLRNGNPRSYPSLRALIEEIAEALPHPK